MSCTVVNMMTTPVSMYSRMVTGSGIRTTTTGVDIVSVGRSLEFMSTLKSVGLRVDFPFETSKQKLIYTMFAKRGSPLSRHS